MKTKHTQLDLGASAFLMASGYEFTGLKEISPRRLAFQFADPCGTADRDVGRYFAGALAQAEKLVVAIRELKSQLRAAKDHQNKEFQSHDSHKHPRIIPAR